MRRNQIDEPRNQSDKPNSTAVILSVPATWGGRGWIIDRCRGGGRGNDRRRHGATTTTTLPLPPPPPLLHTTTTTTHHHHHLHCRSISMSINHTKAEASRTGFGTNLQAVMAPPPTTQQHYSGQFRSLHPPS